MRLGGDHWASPVLIEGNLYFSSKQGQVIVLPASKEQPEIVARNQPNASFIASPAVTDSSLILRSTTHLYCIEKGHHRTAEQLAADVYPGEQGENRRSKEGLTKNAETKPLDAFAARLKELVKEGKLTREDAIELYQSAAEK